MHDTEDELTNRLMLAVQDLPREKLLAILDFADHMHNRYGRSHPPRGSAESILSVLDEVGPLDFEPGELDALLEGIDQIRAQDLEEHG